MTENQKTGSEHRLTIIDGAQYCKWDREIFGQLIAGGVSAIHATVAYHETAREALSRLGAKGFQPYLPAYGPLLLP